MIVSAIKFDPCHGGWRFTQVDRLAAQQFFPHLQQPSSQWFSTRISSAMAYSVAQRVESDRRPVPPIWPDVVSEAEDGLQGVAKDTCRQRLGRKRHQSMLTHGAILILVDDQPIVAGPENIVDMSGPQKLRRCHAYVWIIGPWIHEVKEARIMRRTPGKIGNEPRRPAVDREQAVGL